MAKGLRGLARISAGWLLPIALASAPLARAGELDEVRQALDLHKRQVHSLRVMLSSRPPAPGGHGPQSDLHELAFKGNNFLSRTFGDPVRTQLQIGSTCYEIVNRTGAPPKVAPIDPEDVDEFERPTEGPYTHGSDWWADILRRGHYQAGAVTTDPQLGHVLTLRDSAAGITLKFSREHHYICVAYDIRTSPKSISSWSARAVGEFNGFAFPTEFTSRTQMIAKLRRLNNFGKHFYATSVKFNKVSDQIFQLPTGVAVVPEHVLNDENAYVQPDVQADRQAENTDPYRWSKIVGGVAGAFLLAVAVRARRRRRR
jgi:hypothetical protein